MIRASMHRVESQFELDRVNICLSFLHRLRQVHAIISVSEVGAGFFRPAERHGRPSRMECDALSRFHCLERASPESRSSSCGFSLLLGTSVDTLCLLQVPRSMSLLGMLDNQASPSIKYSRLPSSIHSKHFSICTLDQSIAEKYAFVVAALPPRRQITRQHNLQRLIRPHEHVIDPLLPAALLQAVRELVATRSR